MDDGVAIEIGHIGITGFTETQGQHIFAKIMDVDQLIVAEATVGKALVMKRFRPRARGRTGKILKPFSRMTIVVREIAEEAA